MSHSGGSVWRRALRGFEQLEARLALAAQPIISEFLASNNSSLEDGFGQDSDWIELTNIGDAPVDLQGYYLSDSANNLTKWSFPTSTILNPGQFLIVFASDMNTIDPLGYHHTNYKLSADGEDVVLAAPDQTILSQIGPNGDDYPLQITDVSYGVSGPAVVTGGSNSSYLVPTNETLGTGWTATSFNAAANGFSSGKAAVGFDTSPTPVDFANYFKTALPTGTASVYVRTEFELPSAAAVTGLNLNLKYDDGVVVYLNGTKVYSNFAPETPLWNSPATGGRSDSLSVVGVNIPLDAYLGSLLTGKNVLAIHVLNSSGSSDLLVDPVLTAQGVAGSIGYLATPTPGAPNSSITQIGPAIGDVKYSPAPPVANQPITITTPVTAFASPVNATTVALTYRVMYGSEVTVPMFDDGASGGDAKAGDGIFSAQIPGSAFAAGQMVRWFVRASDSLGVGSRAPTYLDPLDSPQYFGAVVADPSITTDLPVIHWFVQNPNAAATDVGTRASLSINGQFYDNIQVDLHGQSTAQPQFTKKSFNFDANNGLKFDFAGTLGSVSDFNLLTNQTDKTYARNTMAYDLYEQAGGPALESFPAVVQRNGVYYGLYDVVEEAQSEFLERVGLDPDGALYKMGNGFNSATNLVEKKTRKYESNSDLQQLVSSASLNTSQGEVWVTDNLDLASWVNYFAVQTLIANRDYGQKNYYLYRDTNGTQQWSLLPWDVDLSFGHQWNPTENYFDDDLIWNDGLYVYMGGNHLINRLIAMPQFTQMYVRRLRSLTDEFFGPPGQNVATSSAVEQIDALLAEIGADALIDRAKWGAIGGMAFETPTEAFNRVVTDFFAKRKTFLNSLGSIPTSQAAAPNVTIGAIDFNPASGNQAQEYISIVNNSSVAVDISGWKLSGAVSHTFKGGTVIPANGTYYVVADVAQFKRRTTGPRGGQKLYVQGNYEGKLNDAFGQLTLKTAADATIASTSYGTPPSPGDFTADSVVDGADFLMWQRTLGSSVPTGSGADGNSSGTVDAGDLPLWKNNFGVSAVAASVPAFSAAVLVPGAQQSDDASLSNHDTVSLAQSVASQRIDAREAGDVIVRDAAQGRAESITLLPFMPLSGAPVAVTASLSTVRSELLNSAGALNTTDEWAPAFDLAFESFAR